MIVQAINNIKMTQILANRIILVDVIVKKKKVSSNITIVSGMIEYQKRMFIIFNVLVFSICIKNVYVFSIYFFEKICF